MKFMDILLVFSHFFSMGLQELVPVHEEASIQIGDKAFYTLTEDDVKTLKRDKQQKTTSGTYHKTFVKHI